MPVSRKAGAAIHRATGPGLAAHGKKRKKKAKKRGKKRGKKKASKKKATTKRKAPRRKKAAKRSGRRRRRKGQKGPNVISHTDGTGLGKGRVKCPAGKTAVATVAKHRKTGTYVFYGRCV